MTPKSMAESEFERVGESGMTISELFPYSKTVADELYVIRTLHTDILEHFQSVLLGRLGIMIERLLCGVCDVTRTKQKSVLRSEGVASRRKARAGRINEMK